MAVTQLNPIFHKSGDVIPLSNYTAVGFVTGGTKTIYLDIETPKLLTNITGATVTSLAGGLRGIKGYIDGTSDTTNLKTTYTLTLTITGPTSMRLAVAKSTEYTNVDNNTPVCAPLTGSITLQ